MRKSTQEEEEAFLIYMRVLKSFTYVVKRYCIRWGQSLLQFKYILQEREIFNI